ncbi:MFS general substrate transporter [Neoconidiobolus thromboides FSU 785]|nr:MFS general substrate transporter [Neoconidiobolus thromboides FSU 785]
MNKLEKEINRDGSSLLQKEANDHIKEFSDPNHLFKRLDNLNWTRWHTKLTVILGVGWAFDAFEITIVSSMLNNLKVYFNITAQAAGAITTVWLMGALVGALGFGYFGDRFGRKLSFVVTILFYSLMTCITAASFHYPFFLVFRFLTAVGVGAEYTAVNSTISEFIPSKHRGKVNTIVMSFWAVGALVANAIQYPILTYVDRAYNWRIGFAVGGSAAIFVLIVRHKLPESPRWLLAQSRYQEAEEVVIFIETSAGQPNNKYDTPPCENQIAYKPHEKMSWFAVVKSLFVKYPFRCAFGMVMNFSQAFADYGESNLMSLGVFNDANIKDGDVSLTYLYGTICSIASYLIAAYLIDKIGRKFLLPIVYTNAIIASLVIIPAYYSPNVKAAIQGAHCYYIFSYFAVMGTVYPAITEAFPTHLRATGIGVSVAAGRVIAAVAPYILLGIYDPTGAKNVVGSAVQV